VPIYMPVDRAIPVAGVPASAHFDRAFVADHKILQRERKQNVAVLDASRHGARVRGAGARPAARGGRRDRARTAAD
jgi:hypothetical protein